MIGTAIRRTSRFAASGSKSWRGLPEEVSFRFLHHSMLISGR